MRVFVWILFLTRHLDLICVGLAEVSTLGVEKKKTTIERHMFKRVWGRFSIYVIYSPFFFVVNVNEGFMFSIEESTKMHFL